MSKKNTRKRTSPSLPISDEKRDGDRNHLTSELFYRNLSHCKKAWQAGSIPALVDALLLCHKEEVPIPLWLAQGAITLIKMLFTGKTLKKRGRLGSATTRLKSYLIDYSRWDDVKSLEDRRSEMLEIIAYLSIEERNLRPQFTALELDYTLEQRCAAVAEQLNLSNDPAKGGPHAILRSYKRVQRDKTQDGYGRYYLPWHDNPLRSTYFPTK